MEPVIATFWGIVIPSWHLMVAIGAVACFLWLRSFFRKQGYEDHAAPFFCMAYLGGYLGARILGMLTEESVQGVADFLARAVTMGPMNFYGGVLLGGVVGLGYLLWFRLDLRPLWDSTVLVLMLGLGVGRIGCHMNGCDYGVPVDAHAWWGMVFPVLGDGVSRFPTQLEESFFSFLVFAVGTLLFHGIYAKKTLRWSSGLLGSCVLLVSVVHRFFQEFLRDDARGLFFGTSLSTAQGIACILAFVAVSIGCFCVFRPQYVD